MRNLLPTFRNDRAPRLGRLEIDVLKLFWATDMLSAKDVMEGLPGGEISLSTVQSTLERLTRKRLLRRLKHSRAYVYSACIEQSDLIARLMRDMSEDIGTGRLEPLVAGFLTLVDEIAPERSDEILSTLDERLRRTQK